MKVKESTRGGAKAHTATMQTTEERKQALIFLKQNFKPPLQSR